MRQSRETDRRGLRDVSCTFGLGISVALNWIVFSQDTELNQNSWMDKCIILFNQFLL